MKVIEQEYYVDIIVKLDADGEILMKQKADRISIDKLGAKKLIDALKELLGE